MSVKYQTGIECKWCKTSAYIFIERVSSDTIDDDFSYGDLYCKECHHSVPYKTKDEYKNNFMKVL
jgi:hypothetical protein